MKRLIRAGSVFKQGSISDPVPIACAPRERSDQCLIPGQIDNTSNCIYIIIVFTFDESKRESNFAKHGIDLAQCESVFDFPMVTQEDTRMHYGEQRLKSLCWFDASVVMLVWTDREAGPHLISCRYADKHETQDYFKTVI